MKKCCYVLTLPIVFSLVSCARQTNNIQPIGTYCGVYGQEYKNPFAIEDINQDTFSEVTDLSEQKYKASIVRLYVKNEGQTEEQVVYNQNQVFDAESNVLTNNFEKSCARGIQETSSAEYEVPLPVQLTLKIDGTWVADTTSIYSIKYGKQYESLGFLIGSVTADTEPAPTESVDFNFMDYVFVEKVAKQSSNDKNTTKDPISVTASLVNQMPEEIYMHVQVSTTPMVSAQIIFKKVIPEAPAP